MKPSFPRLQRLSRDLIGYFQELLLGILSILEAPEGNFDQSENFQIIDLCLEFQRSQAFQVSFWE